VEERDLIPKDRRRYIVLVIYDIVDNKRRTKMVKCLERYAVRVQKSCFEGFLSTEQYERMGRESSRLIDETEDSLRIYVLHSHAHVVSWGRGERKSDDVIIY